MNSPPTVGCGGLNTVPRLGVDGSPGLPNREGVVTSADPAPKSGVVACSGAASVDFVRRKSGCIFDKSGFLFCDPGVSH